MLNNKVILTTGGTGFFGHKCTETILARYRPSNPWQLSVDELKPLLGRS